MIDHVEVKTERLADCIRFYADLLGPLGYEQKVDGPTKGFGDGRSLDFFLVQGSPASDVHFAFRVAERSSVDRVYEEGRRKGHSLARAPALAPHIHPNYYAAYLSDPDGRLVEFVCHAA